MSDSPKDQCPTCEGAGWDWKKCADQDLQVDDPVDYYSCEDPWHDRVVSAEKTMPAIPWRHNRLGGKP